MRIVTKFIVLAVMVAMAAAIASAANAAALPKLPGSDQSGFGGFITGVTPCVCNLLGVLITVSGPFGGNYIYSFKNPPRIKVGKFFMIGGPVLGAAGGSGTCGTAVDAGSCIKKKDGKVITLLGGIL